MITRIVLIACLIWICSSTLLWRIESKPPAYIFGSIHRVYQLIWPYVSNETRQTFLSSTHVYAEVDTKDETYWDDLLQCVIDRNRFNRTRRSTDSYFITDQLDHYLITEARRLNKTVGSLETVDSFCQVASSKYGVEKVRKIVNFVKLELRNAGTSFKDKRSPWEETLLRKYICDELTSSFLRIVPMSKKDKIHFEQREKQISQNIHQLLRRNSTNNRYFFIVGAAHMLYHHRNLNVRLKALGYKITRICTDRTHIKIKYGCKKKKPMKHCLKKKSLTDMRG